MSFKVDIEMIKKREIERKRDIDKWQNEFNKKIKKEELEKIDSTLTIIEEKMVDGELHRENIDERLYSVCLSHNNDRCKISTNKQIKDMYESYELNRYYNRETGEEIPNVTYHSKEKNDQLISLQKIWDANEKSKSIHLSDFDICMLIIQIVLTVLVIVFCKNGFFILLITIPWVTSIISKGIK